MNFWNNLEIIFGVTDQSRDFSGLGPRPVLAMTVKKSKMAFWDFWSAAKTYRNGMVFLGHFGKSVNMHFLSFLTKMSKMTFSVFWVHF